MKQLTPFPSFDEVEENDILFIGGELLDTSVALYYWANSENSESLSARTFAEDLFFSNWVYIPNEGILDYFSKFFDYRQYVGDSIFATSTTRNPDAFPIFIQIEPQADDYAIICVQSKYMKTEERLFLPPKLVKETDVFLTHNDHAVRREIAKLHTERINEADEEV